MKTSSRNLATSFSDNSLAVVVGRFQLCRDDVAYMYYRSLKTLKAPADLIKFLGSLTGEMPENAEPPSGNEWCKEPI